MEGITLTVSQLNDYVRRLLASDPIVQHITLRGEISNFKPYASGHWYFTLKDDTGRIDCALFRQYTYGVPFMPQDGMRVLVKGSAGLYVQGGKFLFYADGMTQEKVSERVGKSRTAIANYLRLLRLPAQVQIALQKKEIDMGHARALLAIDSPSLQIKLFNEVLKNGYSVRKVEEMAQMLKNGEDVNSGPKKIVAMAKLPEEYNALRSHLSEFLQTKVQLTCSPKGKGKITIPFANEEELEHIMAVFDKMK